MLFTSLEFIGFLAVCVILYYLLPLKFQWYLLLAASLFFYASLGRRRIVFILFSCVTAWAAGLLLGRRHNAEKLAIAELLSPTREEKARTRRRYLLQRRWILAAFLSANLGLWFFFKFYGLAAEKIAVLPHFSLIVPVGISFYTLQITGYLLDVYHKKVEPERSLLKTMLFTTFFPQIIEGPISRFDQLAPQLCAPHAFEYDTFVLGLQRILWGYFKKLVIADRFQIAVATIFNNYTEYYGFEIAIGAILYTIQLYADFSGGIDVALGVGELFGIHLPENFKRPFFSKSVSEFWRRWHITLGTWLRDYIFYPVTLSKPLAKLGRFFSSHKLKWAAKWVPAYLSLLILWFCNGVWHGDGLQYIAFGLYHGLLIMLGMSFEPLFRRAGGLLHLNYDSMSWRFVRVARTFLLVCLGELIFRAPGLSAAASMIRNLFSCFNPWVFTDGFLLTLGLDAKDFVVGILAVLLLLGVSLASRKGEVRRWVLSRELPLRWGILLAGIVAVVLFGVYGPDYDPTPFIYFQF